MSFNLANNIWGTNYIMWQPYSPEAAHMRFRFVCCRWQTCRPRGSPARRKACCSCSTLILMKPSAGSAAAAATWQGFAFEYSIQLGSGGALAGQT